MSIFLFIVFAYSQNQSLPVVGQECHYNTQCSPGEVCLIESGEIGKCVKIGK